METTTPAPAPTGEAAPAAPDAATSDAPAPDAAPGDAAPEAAPAPKPEEPKVDVTAELKKLESERRKHAAAATKRARDLAAREAALKEKEAALLSGEKLRDLYRQDPRKLAEALGEDPRKFYDNLTKTIMQDAPPESLEIRALREQVEALRKEREEERKQGEVRGRQAQEQYAMAQVTGYISQHADDHELIRENGAEGEVWEFMKTRFDQHGEQWTVKDAAAEIEKALRDKAEKLLKTKYVQSKVKPPPAPKGVGAASHLTGRRRTLSNDMAGPSGSGEPKKFDVKRQLDEVIGRFSKAAPK